MLKKIMSKSLLEKLEKESSLKTLECKICLENDILENLIAPCLCEGTIKYVHSTCLRDWINVKRSEELYHESYVCEICHYNIKIILKKKNSVLQTIYILIKNIFTTRNYCYSTVMHFFMVMFVIKRLKQLFEDFVLFFYKRQYFRFFHNLVILLSIILIIKDICLYYKSNFIIARGLEYHFANKSDDQYSQRVSHI